MKRFIFGLGLIGLISSSAFAGCHLDGNNVICNGKKIGSIWCGITGCQGYCKKRIYGQVKTYGDRVKAAQSVVKECQH